jgi:osmotically-inducible protein OsmY
MRTDEGIKKDVVDQMYRDTRVDASEVEATVENGVVTVWSCTELSR